MTLQSTMRSPIKWNEELDEPYMSFTSFSKLRLTPFRPGDDQQLMKLWNEPTIGEWSRRRPYPYKLDDLQYTWQVQYPAQRLIAKELKALQQGQEAGGRSIPEVVAWPFGVIRTEEGKIIADILLDYVAPKIPGISVSKDNKEKVFEVSYNISPEWRGKGLASEGLVLVKEWATWMGIGKIIAHTQLENKGSIALLKKAGFVECSREAIEWPEEKGGGMREIIEWEYLPE